MGEEGAGAASGESGDDFADTWRGGGWPRGAADFGPEVVLGGEREEGGGGAAGGGEGGAVKAGEDVGLQYVRVQGGDSGSAAFYSGGGGGGGGRE